MDNGDSPSSSPPDTERALIEVAVDSWRFARMFARVLKKVDASEASRYANQLRYFQKKVQDSLATLELKLVDLEGTPYEVGLPATALNIADFDPNDILIVDQMVEPIVMGPDGLKRQGTVMLRKVDP